MFKHLKKYNETLFLMTIFLIFSSSILFFNHSMSNRLLLLKKQSHQLFLDTENINKTTSTLIASKKQISAEFETLAKIESKIQDKEKEKETDLSEKTASTIDNSPNSANLEKTNGNGTQQQTQKTSDAKDNKDNKDNKDKKTLNLKEITKDTKDNKDNKDNALIITKSSETLEDLESQKDTLKLNILNEVTDLRTSISKLQTMFSAFDQDESLDDKFSLGNIPDGSIKTAIHNEINKNTKQFELVFTKINILTNLDDFKAISEPIDVLLESYQQFYNKANIKFEERIVSIIKEISIIQVTSAIGIASLFFVLVIIIFGKLVKSDEEIQQVTQENKNILKSVKEGLFLISPEMMVGTQISLSTKKILEMDIKEHDDFDTILQNLVDEKTYLQAIDYIKILLKGTVKESLVQSLNPLSEIKIKQDDKEKYLSMFFNRIKYNGNIVSLLVTIQDITKQVIISRELKEAKNMARKEIESILNTISKNKPNLISFLTQMDEVVENINNVLKSLNDGNDGLGYRKELQHIYRLVHKIKGDASTFGFNVFYDACHQFEDLLKSLLDNENINGELMLTVAVNLESLVQKTNIIKKIIHRSDIIDQDPGSVSSNKIPNKDTKVDVESTFEENLLFLVSEMNNKLKKDIKLDLKLDLMGKLNKEQKQKVKDIIIQLLRNAGVHAFKENSGGTVTISLFEKDGVISLSCSDDGLGIDIEEIKAKIKSMYNVNDSVFTGKTEQQILSFIFKPGFSTAKEENVFGGRGVGLDLVAQIIKELSGKITLNTKLGQGTNFSIQFNKQGL